MVQLAERIVFDLEPVVPAFQSRFELPDIGFLHWRRHQIAELAVQMRRTTA
jgi:hypothetical protein